MEADGRPTPNPDDDWGAELFETNGAPEEPSAAERTRNPEHIEAEQHFDPQTQEALTLLAFAVDRLGGAMVITKEELYTRFKLGFDVEFGRQTGGVRVYAIRDPKEEA
jgi:hypothetical protein